MSTEQTVPASTRQQIAVVAAGGVLGTALRWGIAVAFASAAQSFPWPTLAVNVAGSFALGLLAGALDAREHSPLLRPFLATGVLGAFTTYSTFAVETNNLLATRPLVALGYVVLSVGGGLAASGAGLRVAR